MHAGGYEGEFYYCLVDLIIIEQVRMLPVSILIHVNHDNYPILSLSSDSTGRGGGSTTLVLRAQGGLGAAEGEHPPLAMTGYDWLLKKLVLGQR